MDKPDDHQRLQASAQRETNRYYAPPNASAQHHLWSNLAKHKPKIQKKNLIKLLPLNSNVKKYRGHQSVAVCKFQTMGTRTEHKTYIVIV